MAKMTGCCEPVRCANNTSMLEDMNRMADRLRHKQQEAFCDLLVQRTQFLQSDSIETWSYELLCAQPCVTGCKRARNRDI
jgi:hypothetical protein